MGLLIATAAALASACLEWAAAGECARNSDYMWRVGTCNSECRWAHEHPGIGCAARVAIGHCMGPDALTKVKMSSECPGACTPRIAVKQTQVNVPASVPHQASTPSAPATQVGGGMESVKCKQWAETGECDRNAVFMKNHCLASCRKQTDESAAPQSRVSAEDCRQWTLAGECMSNAIFMKQACGPTCEKAAKGELEPEQPKYNTSTAECRQWALAGECMSNVIFMKQACGTTCEKAANGELEPEQPKYNTSTSECTRWAVAGECDRNPSFMQRACNSTCAKAAAGELDQVRRAAYFPSSMTAHPTSS